MKAIRFLTVVAIALRSFTWIAYAQDLLKSQPPLWTGKPDITVFKKIENDRLSAAQRSIDALVAVIGARNIENTLVPYDQTIERINAASYFADPFSDALKRKYAIDFVFPVGAIMSRGHSFALSIFPSGVFAALAVFTPAYAATSPACQKIDDAYKKEVISPQRPEITRTSTGALSGRYAMICGEGGTCSYVRAEASNGEAAAGLSPATQRGEPDI